MGLGNLLEIKEKKNGFWRKKIRKEEEIRYMSTVSYRRNIQGTNNKCVSMRRVRDIKTISCNSEEFSLDTFNRGLKEHYRIRAEEEPEYSRGI
ncbi:Hypothetical protein CINCED_3A007112 [Cinara cedri]|uniref:Uncharacterized protein n=1 Tax=Cinara cedri TaxID=506608 RepID=A0A5E4NRI1_9HEMI|nr:Hypothetical protein CINCED_3A007112 [Cinara cedri]